MTFTVENWNIEEQTGYKPITTFYTDFSIADRFGLDAIKETYTRAFNEWKENYKYLTELCMVLNWKCWRWFEHDNDKAKLYSDLFYTLGGWCYNNLKGEELTYFLETTD